MVTQLGDPHRHGDKKMRKIMKVEFSVEFDDLDMFLNLSIFQSDEYPIVRVAHRRLGTIPMFHSRENIALLDDIAGIIDEIRSKEKE